MSVIQAIGLVVFIMGGLCGVAWALAWLFELPGFERPETRARRSWDDWKGDDVEQELRRWWERPGDE